MALKITDAAIADKIERLAQTLGVDETTALEKAVDAMLLRSAPSKGSLRTRMEAILTRFDRIPDVPNPTDPLEWDERGLPQ